MMTTFTSFILPLMSLLRSLQAMPNWGSNNHYFHDNTMYAVLCCACVVATLSEPLHFYWNDIVSTESVMNCKNTNEMYMAVQRHIRDKKRIQIEIHFMQHVSKRNSKRTKQIQKTKVNSRPSNQIVSM